MSVWQFGAIDAMTLNNWHPVCVDLVWKKGKESVRIAKRKITWSKTYAAYLSVHVTYVCVELVIAYMRVLIQSHADLHHD